MTGSGLKPAYVESYDSVVRDVCHSSLREQRCLHSWMSLSVRPLTNWPNWAWRKKTKTKSWPWKCSSNKPRNINWSKCKQTVQNSINNFGFSNGASTETTSRPGTINIKMPLGRQYDLSLNTNRAALDNYVPRNVNNDRVRIVVLAHSSLKSFSLWSSRNGQKCSALSPFLCPRIKKIFPQMLRQRPKTI